MSLEVVLKSKWGKDIKCVVKENNSDILAVFLPGIAYKIDRAFIEYSIQLAQELGYDTLPIEYGFHVSYDDFDMNNELNIIFDECENIIKEVLSKKNYKKIVLICKSVGTAVQSELNKRFKGFNIVNILISPIDKTVNIGIPENCLVITSLDDPLLSSENIDKIKGISGSKTVIYNEGGHILSIPNKTFDSIDLLKNTIKEEYDYLKEMV